MPSAVVHLPFSYDVHYREAKKRNETQTPVRETAAFSVDVLEEGEAFPLMRVFPSPEGRIQTAYAHLMKRREMPPHLLRSHGGRLLRPVFMPDGREATLELIGAFAGAGGTQKFEDYPLSDKDARCPFSLPERADIAGSIREFIRDNRDENLARAARRAADLALVGGVLHRETREPALSVLHDTSTRTADAQPPLVEVRVGYGFDEPPQFGSQYHLRADRMETAVAVASAHARTHGCDLMVSGRVEMLSAAELGFDDRSHALKRFTAELRAAVLAANQLPVEAVRSWCDAIDACERVAQGYAQDFGTLVAAAERMVAATPEPGTCRPVMGLDKLDDVRRLRLGIAVLTEIGHPDPKVALDERADREAIASIAF